MSVVIKVIIKVAGMALLLVSILNLAMQSGEMPAYRPHSIFDRIIPGIQAFLLALPSFVLWRVRPGEDQDPAQEIRIGPTEGVDGRCPISGLLPERKSCFDEELVLGPETTSATGDTVRTLVRNLIFVDAKGRHWTARAGFQTDGATIPKNLQHLLGSPWRPEYLRAATLHDYFLQPQHHCYHPWQVHEMFWEALRASGVGWARAHTMYSAVLAEGPSWTPKAIPGPGGCLPSKWGSKPAFGSPGRFFGDRGLWSPDAVGSKEWWERPVK